MTTKKSTAKISPLGIFLIAISVFGIGYLCYQIYENVTEIDTKEVGTQMQKAATGMQNLKSYSGSSVAEYYYQKHGDYLEYEAKIYNAEIRTQRRQAIAVDLIGIIACIALFAYGASMKAEEKSDETEKKEKRITQRSKSSSSNHDDKEDEEDLL